MTRSVLQDTSLHCLILMTTRHLKSYILSLHFWLMLKELFWNIFGVVLKFCRCGLYLLTKEIVKLACMLAYLNTCLVSGSL